MKHGASAKTEACTKAYALKSPRKHHCSITRAVAPVQHTLTKGDRGESACPKGRKADGADGDSIQQMQEQISSCWSVERRRQRANLHTKIKKRHKGKGEGVPREGKDATG